MAKESSILLVRLLILLTSTWVSAAFHRTANFGVMRKSREIESANEYQLPPEFVTYYYTQTLDHFSYRPEGYMTFQQKYIANYKYWGGVNTSSPIFVYLGGESSITPVASITGFIVDLAIRFKGLLVYIEHRYYGDSMPFGSFDKAFESVNTLGYLSSEQALADYAQLITDFKNKTLGARNSPVIAIGGSYAGMLASWFRLKYPHIVIGSLASSAPILYFDDITPQDGYVTVVTRDFKETSESCYNTIRESWPEMDRVASKANGLMKLSKLFNTCMPLNSSEVLKDYMESLYLSSAQYDNFPETLVKDICDAIDGAPAGTTALGRIAALVNATSPPNSCLGIHDYTPSNKSGWSWQTCTEMVMPIGYGNNTMFQRSAPFDINTFTQDCLNLFSVSPRPHWITTEFGGHDIKFVLGNFSTNIIFSNGLRDPYSAGGVLEDISATIRGIHTSQGAHCLDLLTPTPNTPIWLTEQRDKEIKIIELWIAEYNAKLPTKIGK